MHLESTAHALLVAALLVPFAALALLIIGLSFGIAWRQRR